MLLERERELGLLADLLAGVSSSGGKIVLVRGEAGIGKSALVREFVGARADAAHTLLGFCDDLLTPQPFGPFWDIARSDTSLSQPLENGDRMAVMGVLLDLLSRSLRPTTLVIEDTHWADEATLDAIKYLGRRVDTTNGLLVLTYRDGEVDYDHPLRLVIGELPPQNLVRMSLNSLTSQAISGLAGDADVDVDEILTLTGGNPLFVTEVLASGVDGIPLSVQDSVLARAAKLSDRARQILDLVSVIPGESEQTLVDNILGATEMQMAECVRRGLLQTDDNMVSFHHELSRRSIESALNPEVRRRLNQEVLGELRNEADLSRLVHHAREANDIGAILEFAPQAARAAMAIESHRESIAHFRTLEPYLDRIAESNRAEILDDWGRNEFYLDNLEAIDILDRAIELHRSNRDDRPLARALTFVSRVNEIKGRPEAAEASVLEALAILESYPPSGDLAFAASQHAWLYMMRGDGQRAIEHADRAIALAEETGDERSLIYALNTKGTEMYRFGNDDGFLLLNEARNRAEQAGYPLEESLAQINMASVAAEIRELELASDLAQQAGDTAARYEIQSVEDYARATYTEILAWKGAWDAAEDLAADVFGTDREIGSLHGQILGRVTGTLQARRGRPEAAATLDRTWAAAERSNEMQSLLPAAAALAEYMWLTGETDPDRRARFREVLDEGMLLGNPWPGGELAFWLWMLDEASGAPEGIAEPYRLVIEGKPAKAATIWEAKGVPYERALALMHADQESRLEALEIFETLGATAVAAKLKRTLRDDGVAVPRGKSRARRSHAAGLTARQAEVLQLLDKGLSNTEIADRLFVSPRTVEHHVAAVLEKLDCSTRDDAVTEARSQGLIAHR